MFRLALATVAALALSASAWAAELPAGTWAANVDGNKGDLTVKEVKDGKVTGSMLGTDFTGAWNGKALTFEIGTTLDEIELRVIRETLRHTKGDKSLAAQLLGISTRTIYRKLDGVTE